MLKSVLIVALSFASVFAEAKTVTKKPRAQMSDAELLAQHSSQTEALFKRQLDHAGTLRIACVPQENPSRDVRFTIHTMYEYVARERSAKTKLFKKMPSSPQKEALGSEIKALGSALVFCDHFMPGYGSPAVAHKSLN